MLGNSDHLGPSFSKLLNCKLSQFPISYLGIPLRPTKLLKTDWIPLINKIENRLCSWKAHSLSSAGRLVLVKSVLSAIPTYWMSFYTLPTWVRNRIDMIRSSFLWNGGRIKKLVNWRTVCLHSNNGGLGIVDLHHFNLALLAKWLWRFLSSGSSLWKPWISSRHYASNPHLALHLTPTIKPSPFWSGVLSTLPRVKSLFHVKAGNGENCLFWLDTWHGQLPLSSSLPNLFSLSPFSHVSISNSLRLGADHFLPSSYFDLSTFAELLQAASILRSIQLAPQPDKFLWAPSPTTGFSVSSCYSYLNNPGRLFNFSRLWKCRLQPRMAFFQWCLIQNRINTRDRLFRFGIVPESSCVFCSTVTESIQHLFFDCDFSYRVWAATSTHLLGYVPTITTFFDHWQYNPPNIHLDPFVAVFSWCIWVERNDRVFHGTNPHFERACRRIIYFYSLSTGHSYSAPFRLRLPYSTTSPTESAGSTSADPIGRHHRQQL